MSFELRATNRKLFISSVPTCKYLLHKYPHSYHFHPDSVRFWFGFGFANTLCSLVFALWSSILIKSVTSGQNVNPQLQNQNHPLIRFCLLFYSLVVLKLGTLVIKRSAQTSFGVILSALRCCDVARNEINSHFIDSFIFPPSLIFPSFTSSDLPLSFTLVPSSSSSSSSSSHTINPSTPPHISPSLIDSKFIPPLSVSLRSTLLLHNCWQWSLLSPSLARLRSFHPGGGDSGGCRGDPGVNQSPSYCCSCPPLICSSISSSTPLLLLLLLLHHSTSRLDHLEQTNTAEGF